MSLKCPKCENDKTYIVGKYKLKNNKIHRYRKCEDCNYKFTTIEEYSKKTLKELKEIEEERKVFCKVCNIQIPPGVYYMQMVDNSIVCYDCYRKTKAKECKI